jgi:hypothetical protein
VDVYDPSLGTPDNPLQIHDLNPGIQASGLFWTTPIPAEDIDVNPGKGSASMTATNLPVFDYVNFANALFGVGPKPVPTLLTFTVDWSGVNERVNIKNTNPAANGGGFAGEFVRNSAKMQWHAQIGDLLYVSDAIGTSSSDFAEIGHERNGSFL